MENLKESNQLEIPGSEAFFLFDTMGFPIDLTQILADERGY